MVSICPLLWQRDVKLQQTNKQTSLENLVVSCAVPLNFLMLIIKAQLVNNCVYMFLKLFIVL